MTGAQSGPEIRHLPVTILTINFQMRGDLRVIGNLQTYLNNEQNATAVIDNVEVTGIHPSNPVHMTQSEIIIGKRNILAILFDAPPAQGELTFLPRVEPMVTYVNDYALAGKMYLGQDARITDFIDVSLQQFLAMTDISVYPLNAVRPGLVTTAPVAMIHKSAIRFYHKS